MRTRRGRIRRRDRPVPGAVALAILLAGVAPVGGAVALPAPASGRTPAAGAYPELTVDPPQVRTSSGTITSLTASWSAGEPGCSVEPLWYRWSILAGTPAGVLNATDAPNATFLAQSPGLPVSTVVTVVAAAAVQCGNSTSAAVRSANATVRVEAPLTVRDVAVSPNPVPENGTASLEGTVLGGVAPYNVSVAWSPGLTTTAIVVAAGSFSVARILPPGEYTPTVTVTDSTGAQAETVATASVAVTGGFAIGIIPSSPTVDVAAPVDIAVVPYGPYQTLVVSVDCGNGEGGLPIEAGPIPTFVCDYESTGPENVTALAIREGAAPWKNASATLTETVVADPTLLEVLSPTPAEVGVPYAVGVDLSGGVPPYLVDWSVVGPGTNRTVTVALDGPLSFGLTPEVAGAETVEVGAIDATGATTATVTIVVPVAASLAVTAVAVGRESNGTGILAVAAGIFGGTPPYYWAVAADGENASLVGGVLRRPGGLSWNGSGLAEGVRVAELFVFDAAGAVATENESATPIPPLAAGDPSLEAADGNWTFSVSLSGGLPPYRAWANASDGFSWNGSNLTAGPLSVSAPLPSGPSIAVTLVVDDAAGASVGTNVSLTLAAPAPDPMASGDGLGAAAALIVSGVAVALVVVAFRRRRRRAAAPPPTPVDAAAVLRRLIEPVDGTDRATVELLAAEQGVPPDEVRRTLDRLIAERQVRAGHGADGEEILAWEDPR